MELKEVLGTQCYQNEKRGIILLNLQLQCPLPNRGENTFKIISEKLECSGFWSRVCLERKSQ